MIGARQYDLVKAFLTEGHDIVVNAPSVRTEVDGLIYSALISNWNDQSKEITFPLLFDSDARALRMGRVVVFGMPSLSSSLETYSVDESGVVQVLTGSDAKRLTKSPYVVFSARPPPRNPEKTRTFATPASALAEAFRADTLEGSARHLVTARTAYGKATAEGQPNELELARSVDHCLAAWADAQAAIPSPLETLDLGQLEAAQKKLDDVDSDCLKFHAIADDSCGDSRTFEPLCEERELSISSIRRLSELRVDVKRAKAARAQADLLRTQLAVATATLEQKNVSISSLEKKLAKQGIDLGHLQEALKDREERLADEREYRKRYEDLRARLSSLTDVGVTVEVRRNRIIVSLADLLFDSGSATLRSDGLATVRRVGALISASDDLRHRDYQIAGHTDSVPVKPDAYVKDNWDLSVKRARSVFDALVTDEHGGSLLDPKHLTIAAFADTDLISRDDDEKNRRVEIILMPDLDKILKFRDSPPEDTP